MISINHNSRDPMPKTHNFSTTTPSPPWWPRPPVKLASQSSGAKGSRSFITHLGQSMRCNLTTAYQAYRQSPDRLDDVVQAHLAALATLPTTPLLPTTATSRPDHAPPQPERTAVVAPKRRPASALSSALSPAA